MSFAAVMREIGKLHNVTFDELVDLRKRALRLYGNQAQKDPDNPLLRLIPVEVYGLVFLGLLLTGETPDTVLKMRPSRLHDLAKKAWENDVIGQLQDVS